MSWIDKIQADLIITTGDGKQYRPLWIPTNKAIEYNIAEFEFPELSGTLVKRGTPKGAKIAIEFYFQGENHLDQALSFEQSSNDRRPWVLSHPYYGNVTVHPTGLIIDHSSYNITKITGTVIETIIDDNPRITLDPIDKIKSDKEKLDEIFSRSFNIKIDATDTILITSNNDKVYNKNKLKEGGEEYFNLFNAANAAVINNSADPLAAMRALQAFINYPALLKISVEARMNLLIDQFLSIRVSYLSSTKRSGKKIYENNGGAYISAICLAASTPIVGDYGNMNSVLSVIERLIDNYNLYLEDLDNLQTLNGGSPESFIPEADPLTALNLLINYTVSNLIKIALGAKQERTLFLDCDSNVILLTHRLYGLDEEDEKINELMKSNNIGLSEILQIEKGRRIVYYV